MDILDEQTIKALQEAVSKQPDMSEEEKQSLAISLIAKQLGITEGKVRKALGGKDED